MTMTKSSILAASIVFMIGASGASAQTQVAMNSGSTDRAAVLRSQADAYLEEQGQWRRATPLLERSAALSAADDMRAVESLHLAGHLRAAAGENAAAQRNFERAAERALAMGAVLDAANALLDAAVAAAHNGDAPSFETLIERAALLSASPLLSDAQARSIRRRIEG
jgi:hypothetical protein